MSRVAKMLGSAALVAFAVNTSTALAADADATLEVNSDYVFRGVDVSKDVAVHPTIAVSHEGFTFTTWAWWDTDSKTKTDMNEVDLSLEYALPIEEANVSVGWIEYLYPEGGTSDREISVSVSGNDIPLNPVLSAYFGLEGAVDGDIYVNLEVSHEVPVGDASLTVTAAAGWFDDDKAVAPLDSGLADGRVNATLSMEIAEGTSISAQIEYNTNLDDDVIPDVAARDGVWGGVSISRVL
ncbi:MAG: hypothetical protein O2923_05505 [Verrucomicrobia bacterium]|nr:hypothetical protein [Verrucomicrobiota bacterium]MDA1087312.1 hypothetical protein [Verrucomicrobiota bacterium]